MNSWSGELSRDFLAFAIYSSSIPKLRKAVATDAQVKKMRDGQDCAKVKPRRLDCANARPRSSSTTTLYSPVFCPRTIRLHFILFSHASNVGQINFFVSIMQCLSNRKSSKGLPNQFMMVLLLSSSPPQAGLSISSDSYGARLLESLFSIRRCVFQALRCSPAPPTR